MIKSSLFHRLLLRAKMADRGFMVAVAILVGVVGGLGAVGFRLLIKLVKQLAWGDAWHDLAQLRTLPSWWIVLVPAVGGLLVGPLVYYFAREAKGHGVPEVMESVALRAGVMRPRLVVVKSLASALSIGTGGSVGREGPIVQIGSALGSIIGQWLELSGQRLRTLVGCGAAAGIAATFNAPIAGAIFALEVILGDFGVAQFTPIVMSSVVATVISRHFLGDHPAFLVPEYSLESLWELPAYFLLGLLAALVGVAFVKILYATEDFFEALPIVPPWLTASIGGALVGVMGLWLPEVLGISYEGINRALAGELALGMLALLLVMKVVATAITIGSGGSGGVFAPSLFIGAMTGGAVGTLANQLFPAATASPGAYALVGMGAVVAATTHAPLTAILIIFELTSDYKLIVPLMMSCIIATLLATRLKRESIYTAKLIRRGTDISRGRDINVLRMLKVSDVMRPPQVTVPADEPFGRLLANLASNPQGVVYVVDGRERLKGFIVPTELRQVIDQVEGTGHLLLATDLAREDLTVLTPEQSLDTVMRLFGGKNRDELPVVASDGSGRLLGVIARSHLIDAYNSELMKRDVVSSLSGSVAGTTTEEVHLGGDFRMADLDAPGAFLGHSIRELDVRARFGAQILLLRRATTGDGDRMEIVPNPDTVVERGDRLVVVARARDLERLRML